MTKTERGLWVEAESPARPLDSREGLERLFQACRGWNISDLYLQVHRGCRSWFKNTFSLKQEFAGANIDALKIAEELASKYSIKLHAWLNVFNAGENLSVVSALGLADELLIDNYGKSVASYLKPDGVFELDTPALWLDPASDAVQKYIFTLVDDLFANYQGLSGLHFDFIRYPYLIPMRPASFVNSGRDFGYAQKNLEAFSQRNATQEALFWQDENSAILPLDYLASISWDNWRRQAVTNYLKKAREMCSQGCELSVAAVAWSDRAYLNAFQDWRSWLENDVLDKVALMSYSADHNHVAQMLKQAGVFRSKRSKVLCGIGLYKFSEAEEFALRDLALQQKLSQDCACDGFVIFSYGEMLRRKIAKLSS